MERTGGNSVARYTSAVNAMHWFFWVLWLSSGTGCHALQPSPLIDTSRAAQAWTALGREYLVEGDISNARQALDHARHFDDTQLALWHGLALCAQLEQNHPLAHALYQRALSLAGRDAENTQNNDTEYVALLNNHARLLYDEGAIREACAEFDKAARHPGGIGNPVMAQNLTLCRTTSVEQPSS